MIRRVERCRIWRGDISAVSTRESFVRVVGRGETERTGQVTHPRDKPMPPNGIAIAARFVAGLDWMDVHAHCAPCARGREMVQRAEQFIRWKPGGASGGNAWVHRAGGRAGVRTRGAG